MAKKESIRDALAKLDPKTDEHWTNDGQPLVEVVEQFAADGPVKRADIIDAAPDFTRSNPKLPDDTPVFDAEAHAKEQGIAKDELKVLQSEIADIDNKKAELEARRTILVQKADAIVSERVTNPKAARTAEIKRHIAKQNELRAARAGGKR